MNIANPPKSPARSAFIHCAPLLKGEGSEVRMLQRENIHQKARISITIRGSGWKLLLAMIAYGKNK